MRTHLHAGTTQQVAGRGCNCMIGRGGTAVTYLGSQTLQVTYVMEVLTYLLTVV